MTKINPLVYKIGGPVLAVGLFGIWFYFKGDKIKSENLSDNLLNTNIVQTGETNRKNEIDKIRGLLKNSKFTKNEISNLKAELFHLTEDQNDLNGGKRTKRRRIRKNKSIKK
jgi:hypothetical protein